MPYFTKEPCLTVGRRLFGDSITVYLLNKMRYIGNTPCIYERKV